MDGDCICFVVQEYAARENLCRLDGLTICVNDGLDQMTRTNLYSIYTNTTVVILTH